MTTGIYKITNCISSKSYIGKSVHIEKRWKEHLRGDGSKSLYKDFLLYGTKNFSFEILEECSENSIMNEREKYWIHIYDTYFNGYNENEGGDSSIQAISATKKVIFCYDLSGKFLQKFSSLSEAEKITGIDNSNISRAAKTNGRTKNYQWRYEYFPQIPPYKRKVGVNPNKNKGRQVNQYDINMNLIQSFLTLREAKNKTGISDSSIGEVCRGKRKTAGGFIWRFKEEE